MIAESAAKRPLELASLVKVRERRYGGTAVRFFSAPGSGPREGGR